eukprot:m.23961 g.23961  ORF g.23961 m.23961 type:complete len:315 (+) comp4120_c0_seq1:29-973(+)
MAANGTVTKRVLVTGANKGIGLAIARALVDRGCYVLVGSRSLERGQAAVASIGSPHADVVQLDVTDQASVDAAVGVVTEKCKAFGGPLDVLINNAGVASTDLGDFTTHETFENVLSVNWHGLVRATQAFLPLLPKGGRIVNISSAAGPNFNAAASKETCKQLIDPNTTLDQIEALVNEVRAISAKHHAAGTNPKEEFEASGFGKGNEYGLSKAAVSCYTLNLARQHPELTINACTPGWIETDLTRAWADANGTDPKKAGMKTPEQGAACPVYLALDDIPTPPGEAWFYGSDSKRSPLHKYRSPGDPPFDGVVDL